MTALKACPECGSSKLNLPTPPFQNFVTCGEEACAVWGPNNDPTGIRWNAMLRPSDIVAARIDGLREAMAIKEKAAGSMLSYPGVGKETVEIRIVDGVKEANLINTRIAELEATAPEVSEARVKAEAFDAALARFDGLRWFTAVLQGCLAEAKRKGAGT